METCPQTLLKDVFGRVLEEYAFMFSEVLSEDGPQTSSGPYLQARMNFTGPFCGSLALTAPAAFSHAVAANVLGLDMDDNQVDASAADALKELLNVTCGNVLTALAGDEPVFDLTVPEVVSLKNAEWTGAISAPGVVGLLVEDTPVFLRLALPDSTRSNGNDYPAAE